MSAKAEVLLVTPDDESVAAIGPNPYDSERRGIVASAGHLQGSALANKVEAMWTSRALKPVHVDTEGNRVLIEQAPDRRTDLRRSSVSIGGRRRR